MKKKKKKVRDYSDSHSLELIDLEKIVEELAWMSKRTYVCGSRIEKEEYFNRSQRGVYVESVEYLFCWHGVNSPNQPFSSILILGDKRGMNNYVKNKN